MRQGEIWFVDNPTVGAEIQKTRPALIVNVDDLGKLPLKIIVHHPKPPFYTSTHPFHTMGINFLVYKPNNVEIRRKFITC
jgi:mRNA interferase MazF